MADKRRVNLLYEWTDNQCCVLLEPGVPASIVGQFPLVWTSGFRSRKDTPEVIVDIDGGSVEQVP
jgi:hypothetical protein